MKRGEKKKSERHLRHYEGEPDENPWKSGTIEPPDEIRDHPECLKQWNHLLSCVDQEKVDAFAAIDRNALALAVINYCSAMQAFREDNTSGFKAFDSSFRQWASQCYMTPKAREGMKNPEKVGNETTTTISLIG